jgi:hypothetical protein
VRTNHVLVAQLAEAPRIECGCWGFESLQAYHRARSPIGRDSRPKPGPVEVRVLRCAPCGCSPTGRGAWSRARSVQVRILSSVPLRRFVQWPGHPAYTRKMGVRVPHRRPPARVVQWQNTSLVSRKPRFDPSREHHLRASDVRRWYAIGLRQVIVCVASRASASRSAAALKQEDDLTMDIASKREDSIRLCSSSCMTVGAL